MIFRALTIFFVLLFSTHSALAATISVKRDNINLRSGPGVGYDIKWAYGTGFPLQVLERKGEWIKVSDFEKDTGWIHASLVSDDQFVIVKAHKNTDKKVNIRSGPSTSFNIIGKAYYGVVFKRLESRSGWSKVKHESGLEGWINNSLLWF